MIRPKEEIVVSFLVQPQISVDERRTVWLLKDHVLNAKLRTELARLEGNPDAQITTQHVDSSSLPPENHEHVEGEERAGMGHGEENVAAQQENHSRTILAALMSDPSISDTFHDDGTHDPHEWMQGVENFFSEAAAGETTGRLGELADVAAGRDDKDKASDSGEMERGRKFSLKACKTAADTDMAIAMNAEMEKIIRDDLASTKAAIAILDRKLANLRTSDEPSIEDYDFNLPEEFISDDLAVLEAKEVDMRDNLEETESNLPKLRETMLKARDEKVSSETRLAGLAHDLYELIDRGTASDKESILNILRALGGYVGGLYGGLPIPAPGAENDLPTSAYSTPAIARRRRGRPPKQRPLTKSKTPRTSKRKSKSWTVGPSRLHQQISSSDTVDQTESTNPTNHSDAINASTMESIAEDGFQGIEETDPTGAYILKIHQEINGGMGGIGPATFADLLPAEEQMPVHIETETNVEAGPSTLQQTQTQPQGESEMMEVVEGTGQEVGIPSVLSRLKKGPLGSCDICGRTETTVWRKLVLGGQDHKVCNACGLYHTKFGVIRPPELWGDGRSVKKRRSTIRLSTSLTEDGQPKKRKKVKETMNDESYEYQNVIEKTGEYVTYPDVGMSSEDQDHDQDEELVEGRVEEEDGGEEAEGEGEGEDVDMDMDMDLEVGQTLFEVS
ncbi:hypothetical protein TREMEDRAFT_58387 [Tremella mesenterica DSM 1558]|uniref:uncharacterized protein n=1 Tax=Tremella mesenterica (strain ATCC 24925 / CBS 8224 / DSM 1558 / NBRC 9311 / NRRL Y-6157 / RJB 2259-6 / UBC 559-6) TaxID=578456 RepID=UPI0003F4A561|nr:uncharacterized protein TREMEDRAFT_58387 [Tremella mesenterica DSM 1558]EIW72226.1 hypothetical protein TREMEDRAFT_58387 [Tremella mesenterica DSM 1558]